MPAVQIVVVAGVPTMLAEEFGRIRETYVGHGARLVVWSPIGDFEPYNNDYVNKLYGKFARTVIQHFQASRTLEKFPFSEVHAILVYFERQDGSSNIVRDAFVPELFPSAISPIQPLAPRCSPNRIRGATHELAVRIVSAIRKAEGALAAITKEVTSRDNRTPLLLPIRNFDQTRMIDFINRLARNIVLKQPFDVLVQEVREFEANTKRVRLDGDNRHHFHYVNSRGLVFKAPGKDRHGRAWSTADGHPSPGCLIRSRLRLGATFDPRFHYDCQPVTGHLPQLWESCHHQKFRAASGRVHVNISPNDHVR
jgi:hypothetical protein